MNNRLQNLKKNQLKVKKPIIGVLSNKTTFLLNPRWLEEQEKENANESIKNKTGREPAGGDTPAPTLNT